MRGKHLQKHKKKIINTSAKIKHLSWCNGRIINDHINDKSVSSNGCTSAGHPLT
jgi:hypothetical protein